MSEQQDRIDPDDLDFRTPLRRVAYRAGMLLGVEALRDEQEYHRRRLNRGQLWLHGSGTIAGMAVRAEAPANGGVRLTVGRGAGIDGFGRELLLGEAHCIDLGAWLAARGETLATALEGATLHLRVTARHRDCPRGLEPVMAGETNQSTDPVAYGRAADGVRLELTPDPWRGADGGEPWAGWSADAPFDRDGNPLLSDPEAQWLADQPEEMQALLRLRANLLHADLPAPLATEERYDQELQRLLAERARILLARVTVSVDPAAPGAPPTLEGVTVNNLVRPFIHTPAQWGQLLLAPNAAPAAAPEPIPDGLLAPEGAPFVPADRREDETA